MFRCHSSGISRQLPCGSPVALAECFTSSLGAGEGLPIKMGSRTLTQVTAEEDFALDDENELPKH